MASERRKQLSMIPYSGVSLSQDNRRFRRYAFIQPNFLVSDI